MLSSVLQMHKRGTSKLGILPGSRRTCAHEERSEVLVAGRPAPEPRGPFSSPAEQDDASFSPRGRTSSRTAEHQPGAQRGCGTPSFAYLQHQMGQGPGQLESTWKSALSCQEVDEPPSNRSLPPTFFYYF